MKKRMFSLLYILVSCLALLTYPMESSDDESGVSIDHLCSEDILKIRLAEEVLQQLGACYLEKIFDFYSVDSSKVDAKDYQEALIVIQRMVYLETLNRLHGYSVDLSSQEKIRLVVEWLWDEIMRYDGLPINFGLDHGDSLIGMLIKNGRDNGDNDKKHGRIKTTLLHVSIMVNKPLCVQSLLAAGANPNSWIGDFHSLPLAVTGKNLVIVNA